MRLKLQSCVLQVKMLTKLRRAHPVYFMILSDVRVEDIKRCLTLGAKANVGFSELTADGNLDFNVCGSSNPSVTGMLSLFYLITLNSSV